MAEKQSETFTTSPTPTVDSGSLQPLLEQLEKQTKYLADILNGFDLDVCLLDKIARIVCMLANESHKQTRQLTVIGEAFNSLLEIYKAVHPDQALQIEKLEKIRA